MERAFKFLKRTSVSCGGVGAGEGDGLSGALKGGVVLSGEEAWEIPGEPIGDGFAWVRRSGSSCAGKETATVIKKNNAQQIGKNREAVM
jgi:hypothetical protein